ncbi:MAG: hypothetical protein AAGI07_14270 [Bacteroidota bacterium]
MLIIRQIFNYNLPKAPCIIWITYILINLNSYAQTGIYINNNDIYTQKTAVTITVKIMNVDSLLLSHDASFPDARWKPASESIKWELLPGDGKKEVFFRYKDKDGNASPLIVDKIILDTTPPKNGEVILNEGNNYINFPENVIIESKIQGADWILVSEHADFRQARWEAFYPKIKYSFIPGDGERKLFIKFKDHAGNESEVYEDKVILDTKVPFDQKIEIVHGSIITDSITGEKYLNEHNTVVDLKLHVQEGKYMKIANKGAFFGKKWRLYDKKLYDWEIGNYKDGRYKVGVIYRDIAKNVSQIAYDEIIVDTAPPFGGKILINEGDIYTLKEEVTLKIMASDARYMMLSDEPAFKGRNWERFAKSKKWKFSPNDGVKKIYVKFKDIAENESLVSTDDITMDATPPLGASITLNEGEEATLVAYTNAVVKAEQATFMQISPWPDFKGAIWKNYHNNPVFVTLDKEPGVKMVYARFMDDAGNISPPISDEILLEVKPVSAKIEIDDNSVYTNKIDRKVKLKIFAKEASQMMVSNNPDFSGASWETYQTNKEWILNERDGNKQVYAKFKSATETISETVKDEIILDTSRPIPLNIELNNGIPNTFNKKIVMRVEAKGATLMQISEDSTFTDIIWRGYTNRSFNYVFTNVSGVQKVFARFQDQAGNISDIISSKVKIEINPIFVAIFIDNNAEFCTNPQRKVALYISARSAAEMMVSNDKNFGGAKWMSYQSKIDWTLSEGEGIKKVYAKFRSKTGIESPIEADEIILDVQPPVNTSITINGGIERTTKATVAVNVRANDAVSMQISKYPDFKRTRWLPYSTQPFQFFIGNEGGIYTIYARFKDLSGNISNTISADIIKEIQPHNGDIAINNDEAFTTKRNRDVEIELVTIRSSEMMLSESADFKGAEWQKIKKSLHWQLSDKDGNKTIYAKFKSSTGNESTPIVDRIVLDRTPPQNCTVTLSSTAWLQYFNPNHIQVKASAIDAFQVQLSEYDNFTGRPWQPYTDKPFPFRLSNTKGETTIYTRFRDFYGNISDTLVNTITVDELSPENNTFVINEAATHTNNANVSIASYSIDATEMRIANSAKELKVAAWQPYQEKINWQLKENSIQSKTVFVQYKDKFNNISKITSTTIELDVTPPTQAKVQVSENTFINHPSGEVQLILHADGANKMIIANSRNFSESNWESYDEQKTWYLLEGDGEKSVFVKFSDIAGNETDVLELNLVLDREAPEALSFSINNEAPITATHEIVLQLSASGADEMIISNNGLFGLPAKWIPYSTEKKWKLVGQDGDKTVHVKFRDKAGNESAILTQDIHLDTEAPVIHTFEINNGETAVDGTTVNLSLNVKYINNLPDAKFLQVSNNKNFSDASWEPFSKKVSWNMAGNGLQKVYVRLKDEAGNISKPFSDNITVY